jgi:hypothetical protein
MATAGRSVVFPRLENRQGSFEDGGQRTERRAGRVLLLGGAMFAAAYVVVGTFGVSTWGALLAIVGTGLVFLGLKPIAMRSS